ncbi:MAG: hypothetical protein MUF27_08920 [Acidobacteria bacterium]|jgi:hypothetical protein|nr:hypothetical protein [Acidobacteriota bacterium]
MDREFQYTRDKILFVLRDLLERDVLSRPEYRSEERAEEGFEKRLTLEFLLWFLQDALPEDFEFPYVRRDLEDEYPAALAQRIAEGRGWAARLVRAAESNDKIVLGDFKNKK